MLLSHTYREANQVAGLAKIGMDLGLDCNFFYSLPSFLSVAFTADNTRICFPKGF